MIPKELTKKFSGNKKMKITANVALTKTLMRRAVEAQIVMLHYHQVSKKVSPLAF